jgi:hypothetical protein
MSRFSKTLQREEPRSDIGRIGERGRPILSNVRIRILAFLSLNTQKCSPGGLKNIRH